MEGDIPPSPSSITRIATISSPSSINSDMSQSRASSPDSSADTATAKTRVFLDRLYPSLFALTSAESHHDSLDTYTQTRHLDQLRTPRNRLYVYTSDQCLDRSTTSSSGVNLNLSDVKIRRLMQNGVYAPYSGDVRLSAFLFDQVIG